MKLTRKLLCLLLALALILPMFPAVARAEEVPGEAETDRIVVPVPEEETDDVIPESGITRAEIPFQVNPLYEGLYEPDLENLPQAPEPDEIVTHAATFQSEENAAKTIRNNMKNRTETYTVYVYSTNSDYNALFLELLNNAVEHTGVGTEGDYLMWHLAGWGGEVSIAESGEGYNYTYTYVTPYYTTAAQEKEMTTAVKNLINSLGIKYKSDYEKVCAVYDWICANVTYDYANLEDTSYALKFSAYAALVNKTAVCQGYALLFYRLMLELGVDARFIGGDGGGPHAWNIVQLGDYYYTVDATWDAGYTDYEYFLKSTWNFVGHSRDPEFDYWEFHMDHPMAAEDYVHGGTATLDPYISMGYCGTEENGYLNAAWAMMRDGTLLIAGEGATLNYKERELPYWYYWMDHIEKAEISEGVTKVGDYSFYTATALKEVSLPESLTDMGQYAFAASGLETVEIPASVKKLRNVFENCDALTSVTFHEGLQEIGSGAFTSCDSLAEVVIPASVTYVEGFNRCKNLERVVLNNSGVIGSYAFSDCSKLSDVVISEGITKIGMAAFQYCNSLTEITIPSTVTSVDGFSYCNNLKTVVLNSSGTIGAYAFAGCPKLESVTIGKNITAITTCAFDGDSALTEIYFQGNAPSITNNAFRGVTATAYYPTGNGTWTIEKRVNYGGSLTWEPYGEASCNHDYITVITEPTCTEQGYTTYTCPKCGENFVTDYVEAQGHNMGQWYVTTEPSCKTGGKGRRDCTRCNHYETKGLDPMGHEFMDGTCIRCGEAAAEGTDYSLFYSDYEWEALRLVNQERVKNGLNPLTGSALLQQASDTRAQELDELLSYTRPNGGSWDSVLSELGIYAKYAAEMITASQEAQYTPAQVVEYWLNSNDHNYKILSTDATHAGVGYYEGNSLNWEQCVCSSYWESNSDLSIHLSKGYTFPVGTCVEDMGIYAVLENSVYGKCFLPITEEFVTNYDPNLGGTQNITVRTLGFTRTVTVILKDCSHVYETTITDPTCSEQGYTTYTCTNCGHSYVDNYTDPVDHVYEDDYCKWCGQGIQSLRWYSGTTSLNGTIDLNIYVLLSKDLVEADDTYVRFIYDGNIVDVPMSKALHSPTDTAPNRYRFSCPIYAKQLADNVTVKFMKGAQQIGKDLNYSVVKYCVNQIKKVTDPQELALYKAMLNYGAAAQLMFEHNVENLANATLSDADKVLPEVDASAYKYSISGKEDGIRAKSATLMLEDVVKVRVYFALTGTKTIDQYTFTIDGKVVTPKQNDKGYYVETSGIAAKDLEKLFEIQVGGITVKYGALSYVNSKANGTNELEANISKALFVYWQAADSYLG